MDKIMEKTVFPFKMNLQMFADALPEPAAEPGNDPLFIDDDSDDILDVSPGDNPGDNPDGPEGDNSNVDPNIPDTADQPETPESLKAQLAEVQKNYQRLERKFTKATQELAQYKQSAIPLYDYISQRPDLAAQINALIEQYPDNGPVFQQPQVDLRAEYTVMQKLAKDAMFNQHEADIQDWAEDNGIPFETFAEKQKAYLMWKGDNAEKLAQQAALNAQKKAINKQNQRKNAATLGPKAPSAVPVDYKKMSNQEVLTSLGLSLYTDD